MNKKILLVFVLLLLSVFFMYADTFNRTNLSCSYRLHNFSADQTESYVVNTLIANRSRGQAFLQGTFQAQGEKVYINRKVSFNYRKEGYNYKFTNSDINLLPTDSVNASPENKAIFKSLFPAFFYEKNAEMNLDIFPQKSGGFVIAVSATQILFCESS